MSKISVIILTARRRDELLARGLGALAAGSLKPEEVVLVETVAAEGALNVAGLAIKCVPNHEGSFAEARNAGVREARGQFVAFMDDDCEPDREWLARLHDGMISNGWSAAGGNLFPADDIEPPDAFPPELSWAVGCNPPGFFTPLAGRLFLPNTSSLMATKELLQRIPFQAVGHKSKSEEDDSWSYETGREDAQWWRDVRLAGEPCGVAPRAIVWHHISADRFELEALRERIADDGRAHWNRTRNLAEVRPAARDVVHAPFTAVGEMLSTSQPHSQVWEKHLSWASRQAAFVNSAVDDFDHGIQPTERARAYAIEAAKLALSGAKSAVRFIAKLAFHAFRRVREVPTIDRQPRRLLVVLHDFLGDAVLALPMLSQLAKAFPETRITILTGEVCAPLLRENVTRSVKVVEVPASARGKNPLASIHLYKFAKHFHPDAVIVAYCHGLSPAPLFFLDHAPVISWKEDNGFGARVWGNLVTAPVKKNFQKAEGAALLDLLAPLGIAARLERPVLRFSERAISRAMEIAARADTLAKRYAVVHFEPGNRWKLWPPERLAEVVKKLLGEGLTVFLIGSRAGRIEAERQRLLRLLNCFSLHNEIDADELAAFVAQAGVFIGCDSGPAHVAQAVGTPSVLLFGGTERPVGPLPNFDQKSDGNVSVVAAAQGDWLAEESRGLPVNGAMRLLNVERVSEAVRDMLSRVLAGGLAVKS